MVWRCAIIDFFFLTVSGERCLAKLADVALLVSDDDISPEWAVVSCTRSVEDHANQLLASLIESSGVDAHPFGAALLSGGQDDFYRTWDSRLAWLRDGFQIVVAGDREVQEFMLLVELRNALIHGNGELTRAQASRLDKMLNLRRRLTKLLGVEFDGRHVILSSQVADKSIALARAVVLHLDSAVLKVHPGLRV